LEIGVTFWKLVSLFGNWCHFLEIPVTVYLQSIFKKQFRNYFQYYISIMEETLFLFILSNQSKWAEKYKEQKQVIRLDRLKENREKEWYANSKEYMKEWRKRGKIPIK